MVIRLYCIGKTGKSFLQEGEDYYAKRMNHYVPFERVILPDVKNASKKSAEEIKRAEAQLLLKKLGQEKFFLLDEKGKSFTSVQFSDFIQKQFNQGGQSINFIIGGPYGFDQQMYDKAVGKIALGPMTFSHQMIRIFFIEQLYRAMTILKGEPYHHE